MWKRVLVLLGVAVLIGAVVIGVRSVQMDADPASLPTEFLDVEQRLDPSGSREDAPTTDQQPQQPDVIGQTPAEQDPGEQRQAPPPPPNRFWGAQ